MSAEVSVKLKLDFSDLASQSKKAAGQLGMGINASMAKVGADATNQLSKAQDNLEKTTKRTTSALQKQLDEWRKLNKDGIAPNQKISIAESPTSKGLTGNPLQGQAGGNTGAGLAALPNMQEQAEKVAKAFKDLTSNLSKGYGTGNSVAANLTKQMSGYGMGHLQARGMMKPALPNVQFPTLPKTQAGGGNIKAMIASAIGTGVGGPIGGAVAGLLTKANPAIAAVTAAMTALRYAVQQTAAAYERARAIYAKSIQSGLGLGQTVQRGMLANTLGVSEDEIYAYGAAISELNEKLSVSMRTITGTTGVLTEVAWNFSVLEENLKAVWAVFAAAISPAINRLLEFASAMAKLFILSGLPTLIGKIADMFIETITRIIALTSAMVAGVELAAAAIKDVFTNMIEKINNLIAGTRIGKLLGFEQKKETGYQNTKDAFGAFKDVLKAGLASSGQYGKGAPPPQAYMKQLNASSWERMGLNVGGGGGTNYQKQTADGVKQTNTVLSRILTATQNASKFTINKPSAIPSAA